MVVAGRRSPLRAGGRKACGTSSLRPAAASRRDTDTPSGARAIPRGESVPAPGGRSSVCQRRRDASCAQRLVEIAGAEECCRLGACSHARKPAAALRRGRRPPRARPAGLYRVETVIEKPTPTEAEQKLMVPGHARRILSLLLRHARADARGDGYSGTRLGGRRARPSLSPALAELARREQYLALEAARPALRYRRALRPADRATGAGAQRAATAPRCWRSCWSCWPCANMAAASGSER